MHYLMMMLFVFTCWLPIAGTNSTCNTERFEDGSAITNCVEYKEGVPAMCTYLYDEYGDMVFWDCSSRG